jgi:hypothetical protein
LEQNRTHTLRARLHVPAVGPTAIWAALTDPARMVRWFQQHQALLGAADGPGQDAYFRGAYHFWSFFTPHAPPDPQHVLLEAHWPQAGDDTLRLRYGWQLRGHKSDVLLHLAPEAAGTLVTVEHRGLPDELPGLGSAQAYWTLVLENMRLYLLGRDGLRFHEALRPGELALATDLVLLSGLDATAAAWELLTAEGELAALLPRGLAGGAALLAEPPHALAGETAARLDWGWERAPLGLPGVLSWRLAGQGARTRITIVHSGFAVEPEPAAWLAEWRSVLGQLRGQLDLGEDWSRVELE